ncbi:MAG: GGDEF and EAL domain-containing protein [Azoarcus sp.]|jgi:diguanylate cyclase (GGDEF)-like protein|nr:GGDEF and EAL domain-containing protein [Azoarcus sp.]
MTISRFFRNAFVVTRYWLARYLGAAASALSAPADAPQQPSENLGGNKSRNEETECAENYLLAIRGSNDGFWNWEISDDFICFSPHFHKMLGSPPDTPASDTMPTALLKTPSSFFTSRLHPDEAAIFRARIIEHLKGITPRFFLEHRIRHEDGSYRWIMTRGLALRDGQGRAVRMAGLISDIHLRKCAEQQLRHNATHDSLTDLPNQPLFIEHLQQAFARRAGDPNFRFAVLALDLERFHLINDSYSHAVGDHLLQQVADHLGRSLRGGDILARLSGDQFVILLHGISSNDEALKTASILANLPAFIVLGSQQTLRIGCRIGVATSEDVNDAETLLRNADNALRSACRGSSSPVLLFQPSMHGNALSQLTLETELRDALANAKLDVAYQPIIRLFNSSIASLEVLARWHHPTQGYIPPAVFIPLAESLDIVHELGMFVLNRTCLDILKWIDQVGIDAVRPVSVNLSARQLTRPDLATELLDTIASHGLKPKLLRFEVTESLFTHSDGLATEILQKLRETAVVVLIDDFGTGYSALSYLHTLPCDILKLDGSFVSGITTDSRLRAIVRHSIGLAHDLGMTVIAEGIESNAQSNMLRSVGCDFGQGFLFSKPVPADSISEKLATQAKG